MLLDNASSLKMSNAGELLSLKNLVAALNRKVDELNSKVGKIMTGLQNRTKGKT